MSKLALCVSLLLVTPAVALAQPRPHGPVADPGGMFLGKAAIALFEVGRVETVRAGKPDAEGVALVQYRATLLVKSALPPTHAEREISVRIERPYFTRAANAAGLVADYSKSRYPFWFPLERGATFVAAFDAPASDAMDLVRVNDAEERPVAQIWADCERFYRCVSDAKKAGALDSAFASVVADADKPPGGQFFWLVERYSPTAPEGTRFSSALAGFIANPAVPMARRASTACNRSLIFSVQRFPRECQKPLLAAHLSLLRDASDAKDGTAYLPALLNQLYSAYLSEPPQLALPTRLHPVAPAAPRLLRNQLVQPMPALDPSTRVVVRTALGNGTVAPRLDPDARDALERWLKQ